MLFEVIIGAILIAFGILSIYMSIEQGMSDTKLMGIFVLGLLCVGGGAFVLIKTLTLGLIVKKVAGLFFMAAGLFFTFGFPDITDYQPAGFSRTGIFIGIVLTVVGAWLLFF